jgi:putative transcriptional regulator
MGKAFDSIRQAWREAIAHQRGKAKGVRLYEPVDIDVQALRKRIGLTQEEFAAKFGISLSTLRHWERGDRKPHGPALVLLRIIEKNDRAVLRALAEAV